MKLKTLRSVLRRLVVQRRLPEIRNLLFQLRPRRCGRPLRRFGPPGDGGYLLPDDLDGIVACFSPGVCETSGFELDCARVGLPVYMADASVNGPAECSPLFHFTKKFLGAKNSGDFITLQHWVTESIGTQQGDLLLQMDIEGHEYDVLNSVDQDLLRRFRIVIIEFHGLRTIFNGRSQSWMQIRAAFQRLLINHVCVHAHPNNTSSFDQIDDVVIPDLMEMTFLRKDRSSTWTDSSVFPHPLDFDNDATLPRFTLPKCWF